MSIMSIRRDRNIKMKQFKEFNERLRDDGSEEGLTGVNDEGLMAFKEVLDNLWASSFSKKRFQDAMAHAFYRSEDWPKDAKQVGKYLEQIDKTIHKVRMSVKRW